MSNRPVSVIGFDADDTLWQNEQYYKLTESHFRGLLSEFAEGEHVSERLLEAEKRNLAHYGFGIKGFTLSMIETALEITEGRAPSSVISEILAIGRDLLSHPVECLPHARDALEALSGRYFLVLITKGDLFDQERKLAQSGLGDYFDAVEIVSDKTTPVYQRIFTRHGDGPERAMMIGNSMRADVVPALAAGAWGIHIPSEYVWSLDFDATPADAGRFRQLSRIGEVLSVIEEIG